LFHNTFGWNRHLRARKVNEINGLRATASRPGGEKTSFQANIG